MELLVGRVSLPITMAVLDPLSYGTKKLCNELYPTEGPYFHGLSGLEVTEKQCCLEYSPSAASAPGEQAERAQANQGGRSGLRNHCERSH